MSKFQARAALDQLVGRPVLVSQEYASAGLGTNSEVTSGSMMADIRELAQVEGNISPEVHAANCAAIASAYNFDISSNDKPFMFSDGFALIPIHGLLINRFNWSWSFVTGYNFIRNQLTAAMADDDVKNIIFDVNSPGGMVSGCQETADMMFEARGSKPLIAVVDANCHSAAYYLASQCDHIAITPTGNAANIGAYRIHMDVSEMLAQAGIAISIIQAGAHKVDGNPFEPLSDEVRAEFQTDIDAIYDVFVAAVARGRGLDEQVVRDTEARCYGAADALALGLVDAIQNPSDAVESFLAGCDDDDDDDTNDETTDDPVAEPEPQEHNMTVPATPARTKPAAAAAQPAAAAAAAAAAPEVTSVDTDAVAADARVAERARISGIQGHAEAQGRTALAAHLALNTDLTVEAAAGILAASPKETAAPASVTTTTGTTETNHFANAMNNSEQPNVGAGGGNGGGEQSGDVTPAQRILAAQARVVGIPKPATTH